MRPVELDVRDVGLHQMKADQTARHAGGQPAEDARPRLGRRNAGEEFFAAQPAADEKRPDVGELHHQREVEEQPAPLMPTAILNPGYQQQLADEVEQHGDVKHTQHRRGNRAERAIERGDEQLADQHCGEHDIEHHQFQVRLQITIGIIVGPRDDDQRQPAQQSGPALVGNPAGLKQFVKLKQAEPAQKRDDQHRPDRREEGQREEQRPAHQQSTADPLLQHIT